MAGASAGAPQPVDERECIPLPAGSELFLLPGRLPVGFLPNGEREVWTRTPCTGAQGDGGGRLLAPAHTVTRHAAYATQPGPRPAALRLLRVGFYREEFVVTALRSDPLPRQDPDRFPAAARIAAQAQRLERTLTRQPPGPPVGHLRQHLLLSGGAQLRPGSLGGPPAHQPGLQRGLLRLPQQPAEGRFPCTQSRITESPSPAEVAQVALYHLEKARDPLVSFGQGCEGEPLRVGELLEESIRLIRPRPPGAPSTSTPTAAGPRWCAGSSWPGSPRCGSPSTASSPSATQPTTAPGAGAWTTRRPPSRRQVPGGFASINLLCLPGITDREDEAAALVKLVEETGLDLIQWRNLNLDPEAYRSAWGPCPPPPPGDQGANDQPPPPLPPPEARLLQPQALLTLPRGRRQPATRRQSSRTRASISRLRG